jgi:hypothetical protein
VGAAKKLSLAVTISAVAGVAAIVVISATPGQHGNTLSETSRLSGRAHSVVLAGIRMTDVSGRITDAGIRMTD